MDVYAHIEQTLTRIERKLAVILVIFGIDLCLMVAINILLWVKVL